MSPWRVYCCGLCGKTRIRRHSLFFVRDFVGPASEATGIKDDSVCLLTPYGKAAYGAGMECFSSGRLSGWG